MNFTYKIENYYPYESRVFVIYTPEDSTLDQLGGWVHVLPEDTQEQIIEKVIAQAPLYKWSMSKSTIAEQLAGIEGSGVATTPDPVTEPVAEPTAEQIQLDFTRAIQKRLNDFAKTRNYDNILSACSYVTSTIPKFAAEAQYCVEVRDLTWNKCYEILAQVQTGARPMPTFEEVEAELPVLVWPV